MSRSLIRVVIYAALLAVPLASAESGSAGVPAILQFAEHYQQQQQQPMPEPQAPPQTKKKPAAVQNSGWRLRNNDEVERLNLALSQALQRQKVLEQANQKLQAASYVDLPAALGRAIKTVKQSLAPDPQLSLLQQQLKTLRARLPRSISEASLHQRNVREDYAAGVSLGIEILELQQEHARWGINADKSIILAGINDVFDNKARLSAAEVNRTLGEMETALTAAREKTLREQQQQGQAYLAKFKQQKNSQAAAMGYWYQIDYAGKGKIDADAVIEVAVKEMLTDGKVIQDMDAQGAVLSQKLSDYPPVFADALARIENHGTMTLLVPPSLAYGEAGYPPAIAPNAWMIYKIRVAEMYTENAVVTTSRK